MARPTTQDDIIRHKKNAIKQLNSTLETFINSSNSRHLKKADLIAYWIENYSKYLLIEEHFDYTNIPKYKRGDIVSVNFGFNIGSEHGGLHYTIVLDNDNKQSSPVITVIPLSSGNEESTYERDISKLKDGSIALMEQITTISKIRIYKPKKNSDLLYGIKFYDESVSRCILENSAYRAFNKTDLLCEDSTLCGVLYVISFFCKVFTHKTGAQVL